MKIHLFSYLRVFKLCLPQAVVEKCEAQIQKDFQTLFTFLKEEQKTRLKALRDAGTRETQQAMDVIEAEVTSLSSRVQEAEEMALKDDITFLEVELTAFHMPHTR